EAGGVADHRRHLVAGVERLAHDLAADAAGGAENGDLHRCLLVLLVRAGVLSGKDGGGRASVTTGRCHTSRPAVVLYPGADTEEDGMDDELGRAWRDHRRHVLDIAFRMLGTVAEAEDVVQEAFARLVRADLDRIDDVGGWLVVVVSRLCLDRLRAGQRHPTSPEADLAARPADDAVDPADRVTLDDNVRLALHLILERLTAAERTVFVLHDVFQYPF